MTVSATLRRPDDRPPGKGPPDKSQRAAAGESGVPLPHNPVHGTPKTCAPYLRIEGFIKGMLVLACNRCRREYWFDPEDAVVVAPG